MSMPAELAEVVSDFQDVQGQDKLALLLEFANELPALPATTMRPWSSITTLVALSLGVPRSVARESIRLPSSRNRARTASRCPLRDKARVS